jgi:hypothetical protein
LTKAALLLSFWSPYDSQIQVNSYWIDQAFYHANEAGLHQPATYDVSRGNRDRLIWSCCLLRDRTIAFGLRRNHDLHDGSDTTGMAQDGDFGLEAHHYSFTEHSLKRRQIQAFINLCELSQVMASIMKMQKSLMNNIHYDETFASKEIVLLKPQISKLDSELVSWTSRVQNNLLKTIGDIGEYANVTLQLPYIFYM